MQDNKPTSMKGEINNNNNTQGKLISFPTTPMDRSTTEN